MTSRLLLFLSLGLSINAYAAAPADCVISETTVLTQPWIFRCAGDIIIAEGVDIITHEHAFSPRTTGKIVYGSLKKPANIRCVGVDDTYSMEGKTCGPIYQEATSLDGAQLLDCTAPGDASCDAVIVTASHSETYHMKMKGKATSYYNSNVERSPNVRWN